MLSRGQRKNKIWQEKRALVPVNTAAADPGLADTIVESNILISFVLPYFSRRALALAAARRLLRIPF
jgi:hypothetical protein